MALNPELIGFVRESLARGVARPDVEEALIRAGWPRGQVAQALARFAEAAGYPIPVPRPAVSVKPREAFLYAVMFLALFVSAFNLGRWRSASSTWRFRMRGTRPRSSRGTPSAGRSRCWWWPVRCSCTSRG